MKEVYVIDKEFLFKTSIHEITSISVEDNYDLNGTCLEGQFIISGDYRLHEISINKEDFSFKIPFKHEIRSNINLESLKLEITDFDYSFCNEDELSVHVEYIISADEAMLEFSDEDELQNFLDNNEDVEIVNILEDIKEEKEESLREMDDKDIEDSFIGEINKNEIEILKAKDNIDEKEKIIHENMIINSINKEEEYIKYHVHTVMMNDTVESILERYNITLNTLKKYNSFEVLELNMKLIIPEDEEL